MPWVRHEPKQTLGVANEPAPRQARLHEQHLPVGTADAAHLAEGCRRVLYRAQAEGAQDGIERAVREGQVVRISLDDPCRKGQVDQLRPRNLQHRLNAVHAHEAPHLLALPQRLEAAPRADSHLQHVSPGGAQVSQTMPVGAALLVHTDGLVVLGRKPLHDVQPLPLRGQPILLAELAPVFLPIGVVPAVCLEEPNHQAHVHGPRRGHAACPVVPFELAGKVQQASRGHGARVRRA
mmetsp:Transcript_894/g.2936  ORF Transcript_894/g.2936 Transcript_894/m.2936 type:complete len:236 (-) Transcript_894:30-737(-)